MTTTPPVAMSNRQTAVALLRQALATGRDAVAEFVGHEPTLAALDDVLAADPDRPALRAEVREVCSFLSVEARHQAAEVVASLKATLDATRQPLRCPDCGSTISILTGHTGYGYLSGETPTGFECDDFRCAATWNTQGDPAPTDG